MGDNCKDSPNAGNANNVRNVNTDGTINNNNANNSNGVAPDCKNIASIKVSRKAVEIKALMQGIISQFEMEKNDVPMHPTLVK